MYLSLSYAKSGLLTLFVFPIQGWHANVFPILFQKHNAEKVNLKCQSITSTKRIFRENLLPEACRAGQHVCLCDSSLYSRPVYRKTGDSSPLPKCGSASLIFCWLLLFGEAGLKTEWCASLLAALYHLFESCPSIPICEPHIIGQSCVWLLHMGIYIHQRELMDEFQMCFPGVWGELSISRLEKNAPCRPWE